MTVSAKPDQPGDAAFSFEAQTLAGEPVSGTLTAGSFDEATRKLNGMQVRVLALDPVPAVVVPSPRARRLGADDFQTFNTQLAHLTGAGLPVEQSLRLIAEDMRTGRLAESVRQVATELEAGRSLPEAFERHARQFPPLYSQLINAGIRTGDLSAMLLSLGRHVELVQRLRAMLWKALSYPVVVFFSLLSVVGFLGVFVLPQFKHIFDDFKVELPTITQWVMGCSDFLLKYWPFLLAGVVGLFFGLPLLIRAIQPARTRQRVIETLFFPLPLLGAALRQNLLARWCDALRLGVESGLDLPASIQLASDAVGSPRLASDGQLLIDALQSGRPISDEIPTRTLPRTVVAVISFATTSNDLPSGLRTLSTMFQQQAERKIATIPALLTPILVVLLAVLIGFVVIAMFAPMIALVSSVSGPVEFIK